MKTFRHRSPSRRLMSTIALAGALSLAALLSAPRVLAQSASPSERWVGTWYTSPTVRVPAQPPAPNAPPAQGQNQSPLQFKDQTLRQIAHVSLGGERVRVVLSNTFGTVPLTIGAAHIALREKDAAIMPTTDRVLTFAGSPTMNIPPGAVAVSDPVTLTVPSLSDVAVDIYLPNDTAGLAVTTHPAAWQTNYVSTPGNHVGVAKLPVQATTAYRRPDGLACASSFFLSRIEVMAPAQTGAIVALGDSITDGTQSLIDTNNRWPDHLARRLMKENIKMGVLNAGIGGNRVLSDGNGVNALARFDRDVAAQPGVTHVIVLEGVNDLGMGPSPSAAALIAGHQQLIDRAHGLGLKIYGATLTPFEGANYYTAEGEKKREALNEWIRTSKKYDAVFDFDAAVRDPNHPTRTLPQYDPGDHLHLTPAGYQAVANTIDLALFKPASPLTRASGPSAPGTAAATTAGTTTWMPPRTPDGRPDLQGIWNNTVTTPLERPKALTGKEAFSEEELATITTKQKRARDDRDRRDQKPGTVTDVGRAYGALWFPVPGKALKRTSLVVDPPDGRVPPLTPEAEKRFAAWAKARGRFGPSATPQGVFVEGIEDGTQGGVDGRGTRADNMEDRQLSERCLTFGLPRLPGGYNNHFRIVQTPRYAVIEIEMVHDARVIWLDGRPHLPASIRLWLGDSRGHWEGDTLVVDTTNFTDKAPFRGSFAGLHLVERFTRVDPDTINYEFTVDDPSTWTRAWTAAFPLTNLASLVGGDDQETTAKMFEYACHEGNYGLAGQLSGARAEQKAAQETAKKGSK